MKIPSETFSEDNVDLDSTKCTYLNYVNLNAINKNIKHFVTILIAYIFYIHEKMNNLFEEIYVTYN